MANSDEKILMWIASCSDPEKLKQFAKNAETGKRRDLRDVALRRAWGLAGLDFSDELHRDFHAMLAAYEHFLSEKHGRNLKASYTRRALANKGVEGTLQDWALAPKPTEGFKRLVDSNLAEFTGECVVVRHAGRFSDDVVAACKSRLEKFGVTNCQAS
jgi:hypothetical protein